MQSGAICLRSQGARGREAARFQGLEGLLVHPVIPPLPFTLSCISNCIFDEVAELGTAEVAAAVTVAESVQGMLDTGGGAGKERGHWGLGSQGEGCWGERGQVSLPAWRNRG